MVVGSIRPVADTVVCCSRGYLYHHRRVGEGTRRRTTWSGNQAERCLLAAEEQAALAGQALDLRRALEECLAATLAAAAAAPGRAS